MTLGHVAGAVGRMGRYLFQGTFYLAAISTECVAFAVRPSSWVRPVRSRFVRQILFGGVEAVPFTLFAGGIMGIILTINSFQWLEFTGRSEYLGPALSVAIIREAAPFFACVIIISASASAITTELANMKVSGEIDLVESQGISLIKFLIMPRSIGLALSATGLAVVFVAAAFTASGIALLFVGRIAPGPFFTSIFQAISFADYVNLIGRSFIPGYLIGGICCYEGLRVAEHTTAVPQAVTRAMLRSVAVTLIVSAILAVLTYL